MLTFSSSSHIPSAPLLPFHRLFLLPLSSPLLASSLPSPALQDSAHLSDVRGGSGHQYWLDQLGQPEPGLSAQRWGLQSLSGLLHLGLRPSHCHAGKLLPCGQLKKNKGGLLAYPTTNRAKSPSPPPHYSSMGPCGTEKGWGGLITLACHGHKCTRTFTNTQTGVHSFTSPLFQSLHPSFPDLIHELNLSSSTAPWA